MTEDLQQLQRLLRCGHPGPCLCAYKYDLLVRYDQAGIPRRYWQVDPPEIRANPVCQWFRDPANVKILLGKGASFLAIGPADAGKALVFYLAKKILLAEKAIQCLAVEDVSRTFGRFEDDAGIWDQFGNLDALVLYGLGSESGGSSTFVREKLKRLVEIRRDQLRTTIVSSSTPRELLLQLYPMGQPLIDIPLG